MTVQPIRLQRTRKGGFNMQEESIKANGLKCVYVGRRTKWGNPFRVVQLGKGRFVLKTDATPRNEMILRKVAKPLYTDKIEAMQDAVKCYQQHFFYYEHGGRVEDFLIDAMTIGMLEELEGKNLSCFCGKDEPCHADYLLKIITKYYDQQ